MFAIIRSAVICPQSSKAFQPSIHPTIYPSPVVFAAFESTIGEIRSLETPRTYYIYRNVEPCLGKSRNIIMIHFLRPKCRFTLARSARHDAVASLLKYHRGRRGLNYKQPILERSCGVCTSPGRHRGRVAGVDFASSRVRNTGRSKGPPCYSR